MLHDAASRATSRSRSSVTSRNSATRSAPAACAWSRSRGSRNCRPPARRRCATGWSSTPAPSRSSRRRARWSSSCSSTTRSTARSATKAANARCRTSPMGWGPGKSRVIDEKRHFEKPIELSPLVAIDRERCILCYRCVRFSQEVAEDEQLQLLERGDRTFVGTFDDRPYVAPFHGNITDLCPVGALTSYTYRFRARPWDIEQAGSVCTLCPSQCNVSFTVRDEKVKRVVARDNPDVDDGWLCDRGRYGFEMFDAPRSGSRGPRLRGGAEVELGGGDREGRRRGCAAARRRQGRGDRRRRLQRGGLPGPAASCARRSARPTSTRAPRAGRGARRWCGWPSPAISAKVARHRRAPTRSSSSAPTPCTARRSSTCAIRKAIRRNGARLASRPTARPRSTAAPRRSPATPPASAGAFLAELAERAPRRRARTAPTPRSPRPARRRAASSSSGASGSAARTSARRGPARRRRRPRPRRQGRLGPARSPRARPTPAACARPAASPTPARASAETAAAGNGAPRRSARRLESRRAQVGLILFGVDPLRDFPDTEAWEEALTAADHLVAFSMLRERDHGQGRRRLPARDPRRERRHRHPPRRPPAAGPPSAPPAPATSARTGASSPSCRWRSATTPASTPSPPPSQPSPRRSLLRRHHRRRHRRPRHPLAGRPVCRERCPSRRGVRALAGR